MWQQRGNAPRNPKPVPRAGTRGAGGKRTAGDELQQNQSARGWTRAADEMSKERAVSYQGQAGLNAIMAQRRANVAWLTYGAGRKEEGEIDATSRKILAAGSGTSIFDPVLCELAYLWFCPRGGLVLDPFAGGSVRGIVAAKLGRRYIGHELRAEQVAANRAQGDAICGADEYPPVWIEGDSRRIDSTCADVAADMIFSCPPYADLERYSDDPADLSTMGYAEFLAAYREIIAKACARLLPDSFAVFVVGEVRDRRGDYVDFVGDTVQAFRDAGLAYYNEAILVTAVGSLPIRAGKQFAYSRKLGKTHQNVLVFVKGDGKRAAARCGPVAVDDAVLDAFIQAEGGNES